MGDLYDIYHANSPKAIVVFAHGAGAGKNHDYLLDITERLLAVNISVVRFNFPYMQKRETDGSRRPPDRMPTLLAHYALVVEQLINNNSEQLPIFIGGKSMGSRVAVTLLAEPQDNIIKGCFAIGYPFHPQKKPEKLRVEAIQNGLLPMLICQGERDALGNKAEVESYHLPLSCQVAFFADGDHDLKPRKKSGYVFDDHKQAAVTKISRFIDEHR